MADGGSAAKGKSKGSRALGVSFRRAALPLALARTLLWGLGLPALTALAALPGLMGRFAGTGLAKAYLDQMLLIGLAVFPAAAALFLQGRFPSRWSVLRNRCVLAAVAVYLAVFAAVHPVHDTGALIVLVMAGLLPLASGDGLLSALGLRWMGLSLIGGPAVRWKQPDVPDWPMLTKIPLILLWRAVAVWCLFVAGGVLSDAFSWLGDVPKVRGGLIERGFIGFYVYYLLTAFFSLYKIFPGWGLLKRTAYFALLVYGACMPVALIDPDLNAGLAALVLAVPVALFPAFAEGGAENTSPTEQP